MIEKPALSGAIPNTWALALAFRISFPIFEISFTAFYGVGGGLYSVSSFWFILLFVNESVMLSVVTRSVLSARP